MPPPPALSALSRPELEALLVELFGEVSTLTQTVAEQREEIARLKGLKGRPNVKPSGMDKGTAPGKPSKSEKRPGRGKVMPRVGVEEKLINAEIPPGSRFNGYQSFLVQDLVISVRATRYQRERWVTPDDPGPIASGDRRPFRTGTAPLRVGAIPSGAVGACPCEGGGCPGCWP